MRRLGAAIALMAMLVIGIAPGASADTNNAAAFEAEVARLVNVERRANDLPPLTVSIELGKYARYWSEYQAQTDRMAHGPDPWGKLPRGWQGAGENVAGGYASAAAVVEGWMNSSGHRANILNAGFTHLGVGYAKRSGWAYWTQSFARYPPGDNPDSRPAAPVRLTATPVPTIVGTREVGATLVAQIGVWDEYSVQFVQWLRDGEPIRGQTGTTYVVTSADRGRNLSVQVTGSRYGYVTEVRMSAQPRPLPQARLHARVKLTGSGKVGTKIRARVKATRGARVTYRWLRNGKAIKGATARSYRVRAADAGKHLRVRVKVAKPGLASVTVRSRTVVAKAR